MRHLSTGLCGISTLLLLLAAPGHAAREAGSREAEVAIQPLESRSELILFSRTGSARVESDRGSDQVPLDPDELLTTIAETSGGWIAAGVRQEVEGSSVFLAAESAGGTGRLPSLSRRHSLQLRPILLVRGGDLLGAAWLEGRDHQSLAVRFAQWTGLGWGRARTVSPPGPGSQTGLTGVALEGGELLLAWSRFDGRDDELYWSLHDGARWSRPARLGANNAVPDITPALAASDQGATLVWARLEASEYQLLSRRFDSNSWAPERTIGGRGSLFPSLIRHNGNLFAIYRNAVPRGWAVAELVEGAATARHAFIEEASGSRPILTHSRTGERLEWSRPRRSAPLRWELRQP